MTLNGIWIKATDGRYYNDPTIGNFFFRIDVSEFSDDYLLIAAKPRKPGQPRQSLEPYITPEDLIESLSLPIVVQARACCETARLGDVKEPQWCVKYRIGIRGPIPRDLIPSHLGGHEKPRAGTVVGLRPGETPEFKRS